MLALLSLRHYRTQKMSEKKKKEEKKMQALKNASQTTDTSPNQPKLLVSRNASQTERRRRTAAYQLGHQQQPHMVEVIILLFAMFGIPITYIIYKKSANLVRYIRSNDTILNASVEESSSSTTKVYIASHAIDKFDESREDAESFILKDHSISFRSYEFNFTKVKIRRERNMKKYNYSYSSTSVDRRKHLSTREFKDVYDGKWPVILTDCVTEWPAINKWNIDYFLGNFGDETVSMVSVEEKLSQRHQVVVKLASFLEHLETARSNIHYYVQDELFLFTRPQLKADIKSCDVLSENYFNLFPEEIRPWNSFFLWGTRFSRSSLHIDPYNWTGTNAIISGLKRWKLFPPGQDDLIASGVNFINKLPLNSVSYNSNIDAFDKSSVAANPQINKAKVLEFYQYPGEMLIIPPGWYHQAFNELPTLAVSGQIMNKANYRTVLEEIIKANDISRDNYSPNFAKMKPEERVKQILSRIKKSVLESGKANTLNAIKQLQNVKNVLPKSQLYLDFQKNTNRQKRTQRTKRVSKNKKQEL